MMSRLIRARVGRRELPDPVPSSWQDALDALIASDGEDEAQFIAWYEANTGYQGNGFALGDLDFEANEITLTQNGQLLEGVDVPNIKIEADDVEIRNCRVRDYSFSGLRYSPRVSNDVANGGAHIHHVHFDHPNIPSEATSTFGAQLWPRPLPHTLVEYCRVTGFTNGIDSRGATEIRYCWIDQLVQQGHTSGISGDGAHSHNHHNLVTSATGSAAFNCYGSRDSDNRPLTDITLEYNVALGATDIAIQFAHYPHENFDDFDDVERIVVRNNYAGPSVGPSPFQVGWPGTTPGSVVGPNFRTDGTQV